MLGLIKQNLLQWEISSLQLIKKVKQFLHLLMNTSAPKLIMKKTAVKFIKSK